MIFYSKTTQGFYDKSIHGNKIPLDAVEITRAEHTELLAAQTAGMVIQGNVKGYPEAINPKSLLTLGQLKASKLAELAAYRFAKECVGLTVNGIQVKTDLKSQEQMLKTMKYLEMKPAGTTIRWKGADRKWCPIDLLGLTAINVAVGDYSEACWRAEEAHQLAIEALETVDAVEAYDFTSGWPG